MDVQRNSQDKPNTFRGWLFSGFGQGLCHVFMFPYNFKVWANEPNKMNVEWMGERVAEVDFSRVLKNLVLKKDDVSWGLMQHFVFLHVVVQGLFVHLSVRNFPPKKSNLEAGSQKFFHAKRSCVLIMANLLIMTC